MKSRTNGPNPADIAFFASHPNNKQQQAADCNSENAYAASKSYNGVRGGYTSLRALQVIEVVIVAVTMVFVEEAFTVALTLIKFTAGRVTNQDISLLRAETKEEKKNKDLQGRTNSKTTAT
ncbi:hypothetical protein OUZ56_021514 [Daphnia magna]|uniref:Uncharacterized protein n=1 Tax=Daphnia magna TaxID=35525 RepID=A0ABQ9ZIL3_9CRUS|nr:hypothetical protein OUZ56_021514 [Daphnia magna]